MFASLSFVGSGRVQIQSLANAMGLKSQETFQVMIS